jgi:hypothetical protein
MIVMQQNLCRLYHMLLCANSDGVVERSRQQGAQMSANQRYVSANLQGCCVLD